MDTDCDHISGCGTASGGTSTITVCFRLKNQYKNGVKIMLYAMQLYVMVFFDDWENDDMLKKIMLWYEISML